MFVISQVVLAAFFTIWNLDENVVGSETVKRELYFWAKNNIFLPWGAKQKETIYTTLFSGKKNPKGAKIFGDDFLKV